MNREDGYMTIIALILFSVVMILALYIINLSEVQTSYNLNSNEALQHKLILDSHLNYMLNEESYYKKIEDYVRDSIKRGVVREEKFRVTDKILDSRVSPVAMIYNRDTDELNIKMNNRYKGMDRHVRLEASMVDSFFLEGHNGLITYENSDKKIKDRIDLLFEELETGYTKNKYLWIHKGDLIIEEEIDFSGVLIVVNGDIAIEELGSLRVRGLVICNRSPIGNFESTRDQFDRSIKSGGIGLPNFLKMDIKKRQMIESIDVN